MSHSFSNRDGHRPINHRELNIVVVPEWKRDLRVLFLPLFLLADLQISRLKQKVHNSLDKFVALTQTERVNRAAQLLRGTVLLVMPA